MRSGDKGSPWRTPLKDRNSPVTIGLKVVPNITDIPVEYY